MLTGFFLYGLHTQRKTAQGHDIDNGGGSSEPGQFGGNKSYSISPVRRLSENENTITIKELSFIVDSGRYKPAIDTDYFPNTISSCYWSSTIYAFYSPFHAWHVLFQQGIVSSDDKSYSYYVRAVRGGR